MLTGFRITDKIVLFLIKFVRLYGDLFFLAYKVIVYIFI